MFCFTLIIWHSEKYIFTSRSSIGSVLHFFFSVHLNILIFFPFSFSFFLSFFLSFLKNISRWHSVLFSFSYFLHLFPFAFHFSWKLLNSSLSPSIFQFLFSLECYNCRPFSSFQLDDSLLFFNSFSYVLLSFIVKKLTLFFSFHSFFLFLIFGL